MLKEISLEVIRKCPNRCLHCSSSSTENCKEIIPVNKFREVVDGAKKLELETICFSGGEPFLHPDIVEMINYAYEIGLNSYIYSSGIYIDNENNKRSAIPVALMKKIAGKVTKIIFNIEAAEDTIYNEIMGTKDCFNFLKKSVLCAVENGILVEAHFVPMKLNKNQIEKTLEFCEKLGVSKVSFLRLVVHGRALSNKEKLLLSEEELKEVEKKLHEICQNHIHQIRIGVPLLGKTQGNYCEAANGKLNIKYDGKVFPCEVFKNNRVAILNDIKPDNIYDSNIENIYNNSEYLKKVRKLVNAYSSEQCCETCLGQYYMSCL